MNKEEKNPAFGNNLRIARAVRNLSQAELAKKAKLNQSYISRIESGFIPSPKALEAIAKALGTTPGELRQNSEQLVKNLTAPRIRPAVESFEPDEEQAMEEAQALREKGLPLDEIVRRLRAKSRRQEAAPSRGSHKRKLFLDETIES